MLLQGLGYFTHGRGQGFSIRFLVDGDDSGVGGELEMVLYIFHHFELFCHRSRL